MKIKVFTTLPDDAKEIRIKVFREEQGFIDEFDELDETSTHLVMYDGNVPVATSRTYESDTHGTYIVGRVAVIKEMRGKHIGSKLIAATERVIAERGGKAVTLHSQYHAAKFYLKLGYTEYGEIEYEEGCPHIWMKKELKTGDIKMQEKFNIVHFERRTGEGLSSVGEYGLEVAKKVNDFHRSFPEYCVTPLRSLDNLAKKLGLKKIFVKDESYRFGLNAFKVLGGSYAIGEYIAEKLGMDISELPCEKMTSEDIKGKLGDVTFVTATDGNHGRGVAWTANRLGQKSVVFMPKGTAPERLENIKKLGSDASIKDLFYDDCVRLARECSEKYGWVVVQDTSWNGYEDVPKHIMQGYTTMGYEALQQLDGIKPTHVFLQAGVGSMAGAICGFFADLYSDEERPVITIIEPNAADCIYQTAKANDGKLHAAKGDMQSMMAGLCCGEPCKLAWDIFKDHADNFVAMPEYVSALGMRTLGRPLGDDEKIISGESGASTMGFVIEVMQNDELAEIRKTIGLDENSVVLCISTEGDTDKENYRKILAE